ncbi:MAG: hypothetical protein WAO13_22980, partial [Pseudolabrys sp.]
ISFRRFFFELAGFQFTDFAPRHFRLSHPKGLNTPMPTPLFTSTQWGTLWDAPENRNDRNPHRISISGRCRTVWDASRVEV